MDKIDLDLELDSYETEVTDDDCFIEFTGGSQDKVTVHMSREDAEEFAIELYQKLGLDDDEDEDE